MLYEKLKRMDREALTSRVKALKDRYSKFWEGARIAIVENTEIDSDYLRDMFGLVGISPINSGFEHFVSGESLLGSISDGVQFDVFIIDGELQGVIKGQDLVAEIRLQAPDAIIIGRTGSMESFEKFKEQDVDLALFKDPREDPLDTIERILKTREGKEDIIKA